MDFAKKILNKYGWKEGDGLGKHNNGIAKPLKASLKFDTSGFGADQAASDFNNHWWERVFNEAAQNVDIKADQNGEVKLKRKNSEEMEISTKSYSMQKMKKAKSSNKSAASYDNFISSSSLTNDANENKTEDIAVTPIKILTDEELFEACGGRTAHKGARHGLKLSGKLARLEQQEKELLAKMVNKQSTNEAEKIPKSKKSVEDDAIKKQKKCKSKEKLEDENINVKKSKKKKKDKE